MDEKLRIAVDALQEVADLASDDLDEYYDKAVDIVASALRGIRREGYLTGTESGVSAGLNL